MHPLLAGFFLAWRERTKYAKDSDYVFPSVKLRGKKSAVRVHHGAEILAPGSHHRGMGWIVGWKFPLFATKFLRMMVAREGVEPPTPAFSGLRSTT